jgi:general stress protein 26
VSRLTDESVLWLATTRANGAPHVTPIWFVWHDERAWICTRGVSVKARALRRDPRVAIALGTGARPLVGEGEAHHHVRPYPPAVRDRFVAKYDWNIDVDDEDGVHDALFEIVIARWVQGSPAD